MPRERREVQRKVWDIARSASATQGEHTASVATDEPANHPYAMPVETPNNGGSCVAPAVAQTMAPAGYNLDPFHWVEQVRAEMLARRSPGDLAAFLLDNMTDRYIGSTCIKMVFLFLGQPAPPAQSVNVRHTLSTYSADEVMAARLAAQDAHVRLLGPGEDVGQDAEQPPEHREAQDDGKSEED